MLNKKFMLFFCLFSAFYMVSCKQKGHKKVSLSSLSETSNYQMFCEASCTQPHRWKSFRQDPMFHLFYDFYSYEEGKDSIQQLQNRIPGFETLKTAFEENDRLGNPDLFSYEPIGTFSASTLCYMHIFADLQKRFGSLDDLRIVEIGGGYGGLCKILSTNHHWKEYTIVDLPHSLGLSRRYLQELQVPSVSFHPIDALSDIPCDLVISHLEYSQMDQKLQKEILFNLFKKAPRGYLLCKPFPKHFRVDAFSSEELKQQFQLAGIICDEWTFVQGSEQGEYLIYWNKQK